MTLLSVHNLSKSFGGIHALQQVDCGVEPGRIQAVIGPNGAGKTTFFNCLSGVLKPTEGEIVYEGAALHKLSPHKIAQKGIARTWQTIRLFSHMSVFENVLVGAHTQGRCEFFPSILRLPFQIKEEKQLRAIAWEQMERMEIAHLAEQSVSQLPFLLQRRVELARALAAQPKILLLDEPAAGLNPRETQQLAGLIQTLAGEGIAVLLVEHDMSLVMEIAHKVLVLDHGAPIAEGPPREIQNNPKVIAVYLGTEEAV